MASGLCHKLQNNMEYEGKTDKLKNYAETHLCGVWKVNAGRV